MFTDSLWQLISQMKVPLFHTYFPSLKPAIAGKIYNTFKPVSESHFPQNPRAYSCRTVPPKIQNHLYYQSYSASSVTLQTFPSQLRAN